MRGGDRSVSGGPSGKWKWISILPERGAVEEKEEHAGEELGGGQWAVKVRIVIVSLNGLA